MGNDEIFNQFNDLEKKVDDLIQVCKSLEARNSDLRNTIDQLKQELQGKTEAEKLYTEQKALVRSKIDRLLSKLNTFSEAANE